METPPKKSEHAIERKWKHRYVRHPYHVKYLYATGLSVRQISEKVEMAENAVRQVLGLAIPLDPEKLQG